MKVTDLIKDEYKDWESGDIVSISSGTGSGKSYFIQNDLADYAKQKGELILYLVPRVRLKEQIEAKLREKGITNITVKMYHNIEVMCNNHGGSNDWLNAYKYIVCDESHYFINDANFNDYTDISLEHLLSTSHAITLFLSATGGTLLNYIKRFYKERKLIEYSLSQDYGFVDKLSAYQSDEYLYKAMDWLLENNHKAMIFIQSDRKAYQIFKKYEQHATFVCGVNSDYVEFVDKAQVDTIINNEKFDTLFLIATSALDVGVNIIDLDVQHVIIDMLDTDTFLQCLGRKRLSDEVEEKVNVMFRNYTNRQLGGFISKENNRVEQGKFFYGATKLTSSKYAKLADIFFIDGLGTVKVNNMKYIKAAVNLKRYQKYVQKPNGYIEEIKSLLDYQEKIYIRDYLEDKNAKFAMLEENIDNKFSSEEAKELLEKLLLKNSKTKKVIKSISIANREMVTLGYPYEFIESKEYIVDSNGQKKQRRIYILHRVRQNSL
ncbi:DEAD/DEAH box helicase [Lysinibacillus sphaericus]|uniref:DEAD/DEAH box helicase n=1 Tax=Lysinibacillus sphaericus TaxID=1421 RepID=UPI001CBD9199|nr:DEAD/DEAH box helicase [Lysinibacillus sphaericus]